MFFAHDTAIVDEGAIIGPGSKIWHWSHISERAVLGANCILGQNVFIAAEVFIGDDVKVQNNVSVYKGVELHDGVFCGPSVVFTNVINPRSKINRMHQAKPTYVREGATIGANATIICGNQLGKYSMVGAGAVVTENVPDFALYVGVPAKQVGWVSRAGLKLALPVMGEGVADCLESNARYILNGSTLMETLR